MTETPWFPGHIKPVHFGVYKRRDSVGHVTFSKWRGFWCVARARAEDAAEENDLSAWQDLEWRGLTERAK